MQNGVISASQLVTRIQIFGISIMTFMMIFVGKGNAEESRFFTPEEATQHPLTSIPVEIPDVAEDGWYVLDQATPTKPGRAWSADNVYQIGEGIFEFVTVQAGKDEYFKALVRLDCNKSLATSYGYESTVENLPYPLKRWMKPVQIKPHMITYKIAPILCEK